MDNVTLIQAFVDSVAAHRTTLLSNPHLRVEPIAQTLQLIAKTEGLVATVKPSPEGQLVSVRSKSAHWPSLHDALLQTHFLPAHKSAIAGFYDYQHVEIPEGYQINFTDALDLLQAWWSYNTPGKPKALMELLIFYRSLWYPIRELTCDRGTLRIETLGQPIELYPLDKLVWLQKEPPDPLEPPIRLPRQPLSAPLSPPPTPLAEPAESPNLADINPVEPVALPEPVPSAPEIAPTPPSAHQNGHGPKTHPSTTILPPSTVKQIGRYLVEAGLLSPAQVELALADQEQTGMRFGEILVCRGWLKQQTIEFLMQEVILPHRSAAKQESEFLKRRMLKRLKQANAAQQPQSQGLSIHERETFVTHEPLELDDF